jgi:hypothetical protein
MSLITEDGTGMSNAESYISVADADAYHAARNATLWATLTTSDKEAALRRGVDYLMQAYRTRWKGYRAQALQALDWPRNSVVLSDTASQYVVPYNTIPVEVKNACAEIALRAAAGPLAGDLKQGVVEKTVGPLRVKYDSYSPQHNRYRAIDMLLRSYIDKSSTTVSLVRS